jgi:hypothetical protein
MQKPRLDILKLTRNTPPARAPDGPLLRGGPHTPHHHLINPRGFVFHLLLHHFATTSALA